MPSGCRVLLLVLSLVIGCAQASTARSQGRGPWTAGARAASPPGSTAATASAAGRHELFWSKALGRRMDYWVYLPPGYQVARQRYPVLYMLHGRGGSSAQWKTFGLFDQADRLIRSREIAPLIIVTPQGDLGYWMNHANRGPRWGDYITTDLIAHVDATYRTVPDQRYRAIGGISMGGHGAIQLALTHPQLFGAVGGHSAVFRRQHEALACFGTGAEYQRRDPISLVRDLEVAVPFQLWLDMGDQDPWLRSMLEFQQLLVQRHIAHRWHRFPGGHEDAYWEQHVATYLGWYDEALRGRLVGSQGYERGTVEQDLFGGSWYRQRTPAKAAGLTSQPWSVRDFLLLP